MFTGNLVATQMLLGMAHEHCTDDSHRGLFCAAFNSGVVHQVVGPAADAALADIKAKRLGSLDQKEQSALKASNRAIFTVLANGVIIQDILALLNSPFVQQLIAILLQYLPKPVPTPAS